MKITDVAGMKVLVTGAAMGLGKLFAAKALAEQARVVLWDVNEAALADTAAELTAAGGNVQHYVVDVSSAEAITAAAALVRRDVGDVDIVFNNAGIVRGNAYFWEVRTADITATMLVNSLAPMYITREFLPAMIASGGPARIVTIASSAGLVANPRMAVYAGSKWAAVGWSDSVRLELEQAGHQHVKVTTVCPTYIDTGMFAGAKGIFLTPILQPDRVVDTVWRAMKKGRPLVIMPWTSRFNQAISGVLPVRLRDAFQRQVGIHSSMAEFTGRTTTT